MSRTTNKHRVVFFQGALSSFRLHPDSKFLSWMSDYSQRSDSERLQSDAKNVGADMQSAMEKQVEQKAA